MRDITLAMFFALALGCGCSTATEGVDESSDELRQLQEGVDVDVSLLEDFPADAHPPANLAKVRKWSVHYVEMRDPANPKNRDPKDPFNGLFLIAKDAGGTPLF